MTEKKLSPLKHLGNFVLNLFFPINCLGCLKEGFWLCEKCFRKLKLTDKTAAQYNLSTPFLKDVFIAGDYDNLLLAELIKKFKYDSIIKIGPILGRFLNLFWNGKIISIGLENPEQKQVLENSLVIPLPLTKKRLKRRGFNQAEIIARIFSAEFTMELNLDLKKIGQKQPQASLSGQKRLKNVIGTFIVKKTEKTIKPFKTLAGKNIILIDDVATTGATLNEAAKILKEHGAKEVYGLVIAKG